ncbi:pyrroline-5-carboxylate reductase [Virgibacillus sp. W0181]|uniref:pyrroline-5-carboxylate reductase n=1 Tax=Virgibacillus sp. W0181 TaxID=3391581 RepID=UPI003F4745B2
MFDKISFIGAGSMAESIIAGLLNKEFIQKERIFVTNKDNEERLDGLKKRYNIYGTMNKEEVIMGADTIILSTKPYDLQEAVQSIKAYVQPNQLIISVIAGISTDYIASLFDQDVPVIRAMPNTSATIGHSATAVTKGKYATDDHLEKANALFTAIGTATTVAEKDMHIVTGISGSGPAYIYYLVEAMEKAAIESGLDQKTAKALITQTVVGAGEMLQQVKEPVEELRENITSPKGTTEAGIKTLDKYDFHQTIIECVKSARDRSIELGKE